MEAQQKSIAQLAFEFYLKNKGCSEYTEDGNESTVFDYSRRIMRICKEEGYDSLDSFVISLVKNIRSLNEGAAELPGGTKIDKNDKSALNKFVEFYCVIN